MALDVDSFYLYNRMEKIGMKIACKDVKDVTKTEERLAVTICHTE